VWGGHSCPPLWLVQEQLAVRHSCHSEPASAGEEPRTSSTLHLSG